MSVIVLLVAAGAFVAGGFLAAFIWAVRAGQFDDLSTPAVRILLPPARPLPAASPLPDAPAPSSKEPPHA